MRDSGCLNQRVSRGFTLVELLVALTVTALAFAIVWQTFVAVTKAWRRGGQVTDEIRHGDFVMDQLVSALRSAAYFPLKPDRYGLWFDNRSERDQLSWVTSGTAFIPPDSPLAMGVHRIMVGIEPNRDGDDSFTVRAFAHLSEEIDKNDVDAWHISSRVKGFDVRIWNVQEERWEDEWEDTNKIPGLVEVTLFMTPLERYEPPIKISRLVQIPLGPVVTSTLPVATGQPGAPAESTNAVAGAGAAAVGSRTERQPNTQTDQPRTSIISGQ